MSTETPVAAVTADTPVAPAKTGAKRGRKTMTPAQRLVSLRIRGAVLEKLEAYAKTNGLADAQAALSNLLGKV